MKPFGASKSGFEETSCRVLPQDRLLSFGGRGGRCLDELADLIESFSIGGGGVADPGESTAVPSGNWGRSGTTRWAAIALAASLML